MPTQTFFKLNPIKQNQVITAAVQEFAARRLEEAKVSNIVSAAGISRGSFYQYFTDKEDLFFYLFSVIGQEKMKYLGDVLAKHGEVPLLEFVLELFTQGVQFAQDHPLYTAIGRNAFNDPQLSSSMWEAGRNSYMEFYTELIDIDKKKGLISAEADTPVLAQYLTFLTLDIFMTQFLAGDKSTHELVEDLRKFLEMLSHGIAPK